MTTKQTTPYAVNYRLNAYRTRLMNRDGTGFYTCKECHTTESLWNHITTDHKEGEQFEDRRNFGESSYNSGDGTDQRVQSLVFMMMMMMKMMIFRSWDNVALLSCEWMSMEHWWNDRLGKITLRIFGEKPVSLPVCSPQFPHRLACDRSRVSVVRD
jgi:hypothetical protein